MDALIAIVAIILKDVRKNCLNKLRSIQNDRLHMVYPVTGNSTVCYQCRVCGVGNTNL